MIVIFAIYGIFLISLILFRSYQKPFLSQLSKKDHHFFFLFPISLVLADAIKTLLPKVHEKHKEKLKALYVFEDSEVKGRLFLTQCIAYVIGVLLIFNTFALLLQLTASNRTESPMETVVRRPSYGESSQMRSYQIVVEDQEIYLEDDLQYQVKPRVYTRETFEETVLKAESYLQKQLLGENTSVENITSSLNLTESIPGLGLDVSWIRDEQELIEYDGSIDNKDLVTEQTVRLTAVISSGEFEREYPIELTIKPYQPEKEEALRHQIKEALQEADNNSRTSEQFSLPVEVAGKRIYFLKENQQQYITLLMFGLLMAFFVPLLLERRLKEQLEEREDQMRMDYPEVVNKLVLLLEAGMTVTRAWSKVVLDYESEVKKKNRNKRYAYEEMLASYYEMKNGLSESQVYDNFGRRIKLAPYRKLSSLLAQNCTKGMEGLLSFMKRESIDAFAERKELAKRLGEKAGTKMLLPMGLMLGIVLVVIIVPAFTLL